MKQSTAAGPNASPQPDLTDRATDRSGTTSGSGSADSLLAQAQQDVAYFLNQRDASTPPHEPDAEPASQQPQFYGDRATRTQSPPAGFEPHSAARSPSASQASGGNPDIQWSDPVGALPRRPQRAAGTTGASDPSTTADTPPVVQQPLYRDEPQQPGSRAARQNPPLANIGDSRAQTGQAAATPDRIEQSIAELSSTLYRHAERSETPLRELMLIAATALVSPDRPLHADGIADLSERDRELLTDMQQFFTDLGRQLEDADNNDQVLRSAVAQLKQALDRTPPLSIATTALCTRVRGFGDYQPFEKRTFLAHSQQRVIVYIEVENFTSELNDDNEWVTELAQELVIYSDRDGIPVWSETWQSVVDVTRNRRTDFFTVQLVTLPKALSVGRYALKVRMRDEKTGAIAEQSIPFEMVADPRLAAQVR